MTFALDLNKAIEKAKDNAELTVRRITIDLFNGVIDMSPVDTGRVRNNWNSSVGKPDFSTTEATDKTGDSAKAKVLSVVTNYTLNGQSIFLCNSLPYAMRLEEGHSQKQAPVGMVRVSIARMNAHGYV
mgnify:CR=1 FL=1